MIVSEQSDTIIEFAKLLYATKLLGESVLSSSKTTLNGLEFESLVYQWMCKSSNGTKFEGHIIQTDDKYFPDIIVSKTYGVEVKLTKSDKWTSIGNSILETNRVESIENIYILFGKTGGKPEIRYKPYEDCIASVAVTHSPRYVDMNLSRTFFDELGVGYNEFKEHKQKIEIIKEFYRKKMKNNEHLWWIDDDKGVDIIMRNYKDLTPEEKSQILIDSFNNHPEIFNSNYVSVGAMLTNMGVTCSHIRDIFSAGGQRDIEGKTVSAVLGRFYDNLSKINIPNKKEYLGKINNIEATRILGDWIK